MKQFRLIVHQTTFSKEDLLINPKDFPGAKEGDVVEIFHPQDEENPRLLLQINAFKDDLQTRDTISVEQSIAVTFGLQTYKNVSMRVVAPTEVALDSVELTFKDQYMGRSEMWRLKNSLTNTCVYMNKKLEFCGGAVRCQVYEMWSQGDRVACGVITDDTKVVFRSSTSMVYLFLQMSSEMWDFDIHGDLYFEKAVNGFLADLFAKWKKNGSNHEVTIVLFSRTFYEASSLEEFPTHMRECLQIDYRGRYHEDFYRVAVQNERYDDWSQILVQLRHLFSGYLKVVLEYHSKVGQNIPAATNSTAAQGNFLEVLNMSLNVFEKHYLDRSFERTGQLSVVVTPGVGVFEVDRELTNVTKQRIIDNGVGSDLVCVGEQPLHAVPLLKFHNKDSKINAPDDYSMPHWINLSFYSSNKKIPYSNFIPRIKLPPPLPSNNKIFNVNDLPKTKLLSDEEYIHNSFFDYDAYDAQVFQLPPAHGTSSLQRMMSRGKRTPTLTELDDSRGIRRKMSDPDIHHLTDGTQRSQVIVIPPAPHTTVGSPLTSPHCYNDDLQYMKLRAWTSDLLDSEMSPPLRVVVGSAGSPPTAGFTSSTRPSRALINPFDPSHVTIKLTSNRRRWTHIFPKGPTGVLIQQHHYQAVPAQQELADPAEYPIQGVHQNALHPLTRTPSQIALQEYCRKQKPSIAHGPSSHSVIQHGYVSKSSTLLWGATGEMEWTPALTTVLIGVDWKSLTIPACLPITTDYFPDKRALQNDYVVSLYNLLPDDVNADFAQQRAVYKKPLTTAKVFKELVSQRLAQGFQLILLPSSNDSQNSSGKGTPTSGGASLLRKRTAEMESTEQYLLSIGRVFHKISLSGNAITVTMYRPRHPYPPFNIHYRYRFHAPHHDTYEVSWVSFTTEKLETYNWNYLDHYICTRGDTDFLLVEALKYWRFRVYLLPYTNAATKRIIEGSAHCDLYTPQTAADHSAMIEGFLKFIESVVNKIKRSHPSKKTRVNVGSNSPFRERLGSNRLPDRPRPRSGSKVERGRVSPATENISQPSENQNYDSNNEDSISTTEPILQSTSTCLEILEAIRHPLTGVGFLISNSGLPAQTFVCADAVHWLKIHVDGVNTNERALQILQTMLNERLICHASGVYDRQLIFGFFLYYIVVHDKAEHKDCHQHLGDLQSFENEWLEVEVRTARGWLHNDIPGAVSVPKTIADREVGVPLFLCDSIDNTYLLGDTYIDSPLYKHIHLETDVSGKSDRVEWGHARYHTIFRPDQAYELVVEWLTSSGSIVAELLFGWTRKAQACGLLMIPIPHDPLALPFSNKSDPLRGPIFIPLDTDCLLKNKTLRLFEEFREDTWADRLFLFQEAIVARFGFISCLVEPTTTGNSSQVSQDHQYIHCTGTAFILIPGPSPRNRHRLTSMNQRRAGQANSRYPVHIDVVPSPHEAYITRHVSGKNKDDYENSRRNGFLWSWNHMVSRRWRPSTTQDNSFQLKLFKDFRSFCSNHNERLRQFWDQCWKAKEDSCLSPSI